MASTLVLNNGRRVYSGTQKNIIAKAALSLSDLISINLALFLAAATVQGIWGNLDIFIPPQQLEIRFITQLVMSVVCIAGFWMRLRHYTYRKPFWFELNEIIKTLVIFSLLDLALIAFSRWDFSRTLWSFTWIYALILLPLLRACVKRALIHAGQWQKQTIIIGSGKNAREAYAALQSEELLGYDVIAFVACQGHGGAEKLNGVPVITAKDIVWDRVDLENTQFVVAMEYEQQVMRDDWLKLLSKKRCRSVSVIPTLRGVPLYGTDMSYIFSHEVIILRVSNNLAKRSSRFLKRTFDILVASLLLLFLSPAFALICWMVGRDGGARIYGHERVGQHGKKFKCLKFRSMVTNSKDVLDALLATSEEARAEWDKDFKLKNDPRITKIGALLRKTSLDELPQLWNVIRGEMSLVGPRPVIEAELARYAADVDYYLMAKPGMTGIWQVSGRNDVDYDTRVYFDSWYVKKWALWTDVAIMFKTAGVVLRRDGAY